MFVFANQLFILKQVKKEFMYSMGTLITTLTTFTTMVHFRHSLYYKNANNNTNTTSARKTDTHKKERNK